MSVLVCQMSIQLIPLLGTTSTTDSMLPWPIYACFRSFFNGINNTFQCFYLFSVWRFLCACVYVWVCVHVSVCVCICICVPASVVCVCVCMCLVARYSKLTGGFKEHPVRWDSCNSSRWQRCSNHSSMWLRALLFMNTNNSVVAIILQCDCVPYHHVVGQTTCVLLRVFARSDNLCPVACLCQVRQPVSCCMSLPGQTTCVLLRVFARSDNLCPVACLRPVSQLQCPVAQDSWSKCEIITIINALFHVLWNYNNKCFTPCTLKQINPSGY